MARAQYIYVLCEQDNGVLRAFTVKHELRRYIEEDRDFFKSHMCWVIRVRDGFYGDSQWTHFTIDEVLNDTRKVRSA